MSLQRCMCSVLRLAHHQVSSSTLKGFLSWQGNRSFSKWYPNSWAVMLDTHSTRNTLTNEVMTRRYGSKKAKQKKGASKPLKLDPSLGYGVVDLEVLRDELVAYVDNLSTEMASKFAAKLTPATIDKIPVRLESGKQLKMMEVGSIKEVNGEIIIQPMLQVNNIQKLILDSIDKTGLKVNPVLVGSDIKMSLPRVSSDYKENLLKLAKATVENTKSAIKKHQTIVLSKIRKKKASLSKDEMRQLETQINTITKHCTDLADGVYKQKVNDLK